MSIWFTTLLAIRAGDPEWQAIASYREPVRRFLARVYPRLGADVRDDVTHEVLCAMKTSVVERFDASRGRFRDYLRGVIRNQVRKAAAKLPTLEVDLERLQQVEPDELDAIDLAARLVRAVRDVHDALLSGGAPEREVLYCLSDRLLDGLSYKQIASKEDLSIDQVKRRLQSARRAVIEALLKGALDDAGIPSLPSQRAQLAEALLVGLASRRPRDAFADDPQAQAAAALTEAIQAGVRRFPGLDSPDGEDFVSALRGVLDHDGGLA